MTLLRFILNAPRRDLRAMILLSLLSGIANAALIVAINEIAERAVQGQPTTTLDIIWYLGAFLLFFFGNKYALLRATKVIESLLRDLRVDVMDRLRRSDLPQVDRLGRSSLYTMISEQTNGLSVVFPLLIDALQQSVLMIMALIYLTFLLPSALIVFACATFVGALIYMTLQRRIAAQVSKLINRQRHFVDGMDPLMQGAKELRLNAKRDDALFEDIKQRSVELNKTLVRTGDSWTELMLLGHGVTHIVIGFIIFYLPQHGSGFGTVSFQVIPVLLFSLGPLLRIATQAPEFLQIDAGLGAIKAVQSQLAQPDALDPEDAQSAVEPFLDFSKITLEDIGYRHVTTGDEPGFAIGPISLNIKRGEVVFLTGGNGSGKSTLLNVIAGLLQPGDGTIALDDTKIQTPKERAGYRELFSSVFVDYHLFDRMYGLEHVSDAEVNQLIDDMGLGGVTRFENGQFTTLNLSTGQKKRLALIVSILEDRPILLLDEWSAEQDVMFRDRFYTSIIPQLATSGKTIIAVTHDEKYWSAADRIMKFDMGRMVSTSSPAK